MKIKEKMISHLNIQNHNNELYFIEVVFDHELFQQLKKVCNAGICQNHTVTYKCSATYFPQAMKIFGRFCGRHLRVNMENIMDTQLWDYDITSRPTSHEIGVFFNVPDKPKDNMTLDSWVEKKAPTRTLPFEPNLDMFAVSPLSPVPLNIDIPPTPSAPEKKRKCKYILNLKKENYLELF